MLRARVAQLETALRDALTAIRLPEVKALAALVADGQRLLIAAETATAAKVASYGVPINNRDSAALAEYWSTRRAAEQAEHELRHFLRTNANALLTASALLAAQATESSELGDRE